MSDALAPAPAEGEPGARPAARLLAALLLVGGLLAGAAMWQARMAADDGRTATRATEQRDFFTVMAASAEKTRFSAQMAQIGDRSPAEKAAPTRTEQEAGAQTRRYEAEALRYERESDAAEAAAWRHGGSGDDLFAISAAAQAWAVYLVLAGQLRRATAVGALVLAAAGLLWALWPLLRSLNP